MHAVYKMACEGRDCPPMGLSAWIVVFSAAQLILSQVWPHMQSACHPGPLGSMLDVLAQR